MTISSLRKGSGWRHPAHCRRAVALLGLPVLAIFAVACGAANELGVSNGQADGDDERPTVVVTTDIWADVVANVTCHDLVKIETLIPSGADPHSFEPSLRDRATLDEAALIVANGLNLEESLVDTLDAAADDGVPVFEMAAHVDTIAVDLGHDDHHGADPHIWFDPVRVADALPALTQMLSDHVDIDPAAVESCASAYRSELAGLDGEIAEMVAQLPQSRRKLVTGHGSLGYFADRYGFEVAGSVIPAASSMAASNPAQLEELAELMEREDIVAVFIDAEQASDDVDALAQRLEGVTVVPLQTGSLGHPENGDATYVGFLGNNARLIVDGLS